MRGIKVQDKVCLGVVLALRVSFPQSMKRSGRGLMTVEFLWEDLSLGGEWSSEKASPCIGWISTAYRSK